MAAVVHHERARCLALLYQACRVGVRVARRRAFTLVGVPHYALYLERGVDFFNECRHLVSVTHVLVVVAVVAHEHELVLPTAGVCVLDVVDGLVNHYLGFSLVAHGKTPHGHVELVGCERIAALSVVKIAEETVVNIAIHVVERVFALVAEQQVVSVKA